MNIKKQPLTKEFIDTETNILKDLVQVYVQSRGKEDGSYFVFLFIPEYYQQNLIFLIL